MKKITVAFCTYNRSDRLDVLVAALRSQVCPIPFDILAVNNNSADNTLSVLERLASMPGPNLRYVTEMEAGIVPARNRAIEESLTSDYMIFIDDDELPAPGFIASAYDALFNEDAECVGGCVEVDFSGFQRPKWLGDELLGFLAEVKYGETPFWVIDASTPLWTANIAFDMRIFRSDPSLRFDKRYNREGGDLGGGEDAIMFKSLLTRGVKIRYRPDMRVRHFVEMWKLKRRYFLKLHYRAGYRSGLYQLPAYQRIWFGVPPFLVVQCASHFLITFSNYLKRKPGALRQAMNFTYALGQIVGYAKRGARPVYD